MQAPGYHGSGTDMPDIDANNGVKRALNAGNLSNLGQF